MTSPATTCLTLGLRPDHQVRLTVPGLDEPIIVRITEWDSRRRRMSIIASPKVDIRREALVVQ